MTDATACEVPLTEQLRQAPVLSRLVINDGEYSTTYIPVGVLMHKAADLIDAQTAEIERLRVDAERIDWIEEHARKRKIEIAVSMLKTGFEFGFWPACRAIARTGTLRECIDAAMKDQK